MPQKSNVNEGSSPTREAGRSGGGASELVQNVKEAAEEAADQARSAAETRLSRPRRRAADALADVARSLRETGEKLDESSGLELDEYAARAADGIDRLSGYLRSRRLNDVARDVEGFARREPALFFGGAFVLGLLGSRFLKSSRPERPSTGARTPAYAPAASTPVAPRFAEVVERPSPGGLTPSSPPKRPPAPTSATQAGPEPFAKNGPSSASSGELSKTQGKP